ncbi:hypothetical protein [Cytobacillus depressus]|nr:hypothetical protein [Cytobacillus depressus]
MKEFLTAVINEIGVDQTNIGFSKNKADMPDNKWGNPEETVSL